MSISRLHPADAAPRPSDVLAAVAERRAAADRAEVEILELAAWWADAHPADDGAPGDRRWEVPQPVPARAVTDTDRLVLSEWHPDLLGPDGELRLDTSAADDDASTWAGVPALAWDAPAAFAAANRTSTGAATALIRDALVLRHRLPRTWRAVRAGRVVAWRARRIAQMVLSQPVDVVEAVDERLAPVAGSIGPVALGDLLDATMLRLHGELRELEQVAALDRRHVTLDEGSINHTGLADLVIHSDWADLKDLDGTIARLAHALTDPALAARVDPVHAAQIAGAELGVRRALAAGALADPERAAALLRLVGQAPADDDAPQDPPPRRTVELVVHLTDLTLRGLDPVSRCEQLGPVLADVVAGSCSRPAASVHVRPVIDLDEVPAPASCYERDSYDIGDRLRETVALLHPRCVHPYCERPARRCDHDHTVEWPVGPTCVHNLAPLCRHHHRLKTHTAWRYEAVDPVAGVYHWTSPHGLSFVVDHRGTHPCAERGLEAPR